MTLSVCCLTRDPGARVAATLGQLRPVADEIVVAVDSRLDPGLLGRFAQVADRLLRYEFADSALQAMPWIHAQCSGEWIFQVDGDEVVSPAVLERLPQLLEARDVFQYWLPCRWLFPDASHYLAQPPWHFSAPRLVRNDPATRWHPGLSHTRPEPVFPARHLSDGFYHLTLLINEVERREAKVARYLTIESPHDRRVLETDVAAFYLPERDQTFAVNPVPVPAGDRAAIAEVLVAGGPERPGPPALEVPLATWAEIARVWPRRALAPSAYQARIEAFEPEPRMQAGEQRPVTVRVSNDGSEWWPGQDREPAIKLTHRWVDKRGRSREALADTCLPARLGPGESALVPVAVRAPATPGPHTLELSLIHEDPAGGRPIRSFAGVRIPVIVRPAPAAPRDTQDRRRARRLPRLIIRRRRPSPPVQPPLPPPGLAHLTFDDGPGEWTEPLLEVLRAHRARATFFVIGENARRLPHLVQAAARDGHQIANHTEDHSPLPLAGTDDEVIQRLLPTSDLIEELTGRRPALFRPPWGLTNPDVERLAGSLGMRQMLWTRDSEDSARPGARKIAATIASAGPQDIVLLHDGAPADRPAPREQTVEGVARALASLS